ncbi:hypothetical protein VIGAN_04256200 [Vigna angularis var. angularis]|uniref:Uncharacterized protein n=1 Tax=Vigna angularis var. angularis TaxID=157739 RepID=A0A0S3RWU9_PHAAN|nr:hypothetical protein VIGAN_04256200 [Vigna angularis var. angularis]
MSKVASLHGHHHQNRKSLSSSTITVNPPLTSVNPSIATILTASPQRAASAINAPAPLHELLAPGRTTRTTLHRRRTIYSGKIIFFTRNLHCETFTNLNRSAARLSSSPSSPPSHLHLQPCTQKNQPKNPKSNPK